MTASLSLVESVEAGVPSPLLAEVCQFIGAARQWVASAVNAELTQLYGHIGHRISAQALQGQRGKYGKQVVAELARQLTADFGKGWSEQQLRHCLRLAGVFADAPILSTVRRELSWSYRNTSPHRHRAQPCRPSCARLLPLPARKCSVMRTNRTLLVLQAAASDAEEKNMRNMPLALTHPALTAIETIVNDRGCPVHLGLQLSPLARLVTLTGSGIKSTHQIL